MNVIESFRTALNSLAANRLRSALTMLGVVIGVAAVVSLVGVGRGVSAAIDSQFQSMGTNLLFVQPGASNEGGVHGATGSATSLTLEDAEAIADPSVAPSVLAVAPQTSSFAQIVANGQNTNARVLGTTPAYATVRNVQVASGEFIDQAHEQAGSSVVVLGSQVAEDLFGTDDPVGQNVMISGVPMRVIGVLAAKGGMDSVDENVVMPISTLMKRVSGSTRVLQGGHAISSINVQVVNAASLDSATQEITALLRERHRITGEDDFSIMTQEDFISAASQVTNILTVFLAGIAAISLLVGGIGIMNIMLVSVTERTREIGIRKAVGAMQRDVLVQFLTEAVMLSVAGGVLGILGGIGIAHLIGGLNLSGTTLKPLVQWDSMALAVLFSAGVGLFFGVYPAWRAARLHPIDALRYE